MRGHELIPRAYTARDGGRDWCSGCGLWTGDRVRSRV